MKKYGPVVFRLRLLASLQKIEMRNKLDKLNLHPGQPMILNAIHNNPGITQFELSQKTKVTPASIATSTKRMEKMGYLCKEEDPNNLRCKRLYLTELGERLNNDALKGIDEMDQKLFKGISEEELETLVNIYDKLIINLAEIEKNETRLTKEELCEIVDKIKEKEENQND
jgi:DNA-binding MarR family transcriptional regulator